MILEVGIEQYPHRVNFVVTPSTSVSDIIKQVGDEIFISGVGKLIDWPKLEAQPRIAPSHVILLTAPLV